MLSPTNYKDFTERTEKFAIDQMQPQSQNRYNTCCNNNNENRFFRNNNGGFQNYTGKKEIEHISCLVEVFFSA